MKRRPVGLEIALIALLCLLAYAPSFSIPLMEDDYGNLSFAWDHGSLASLPALFHESVFRLRATSYWLMLALWKAFGLKAWAYHLASLTLHFANCCLVYAIARLVFAAGDLAVEWADSAGFWAAAFFAVYEGHQEAIMWFSAANELLLFLFGAGSLLCWWLAGREDVPRAGRWVFEAVSVAMFALALVSQESAIVWLPLFLVAGAPNWRRSAIRLLPHAALAALAVASVLSTRDYSFRFSDGSFSLAAPFWITWPRSFARMLWVWGWLALAVVAWFRKLKLRKLKLRKLKLVKATLAALAWIGIALAPYSFLTYSTEIPSRQTYIASAGLAFLFGLAMARLRAEPGAARKWAMVAALAMVATNVAYLATKKRTQFLRRAEPTEQLIRLARQTPGPIWVRCFPRSRYIAEEAVRVGAGRSPEILVWSEREAEARHAKAKFCVEER